jgi:galactokinase
MMNRVIEEFENWLGERPTYIVQSPGRVNLIGEHTDYNDGFVLPMAIDRATWIALRPRTDSCVRIRSFDFGETLSFDLRDFSKDSKSWIEYPKGVAWALRSEGHSLRGWDGVVASNVPRGAGLSSSASFELAIARAFLLIADEPWDAPKMALLSQKAENQWVGVNCGIMDQMICAVGVRGHAVLIDCRDLSCKPVPLPEGTSILIMDTGTRRGLVDSAYNERRQQCETSAGLLGVPALRDIDLATFIARTTGNPAQNWTRARHVVSENERTLAAAAAMKAGDAVTLGRLMDESHRSLRDDFEVSTLALDAMVCSVRKLDGCYGARMTGAGFGGCAVALVVSDRADAIIAEASVEYENVVGITPRIYLCTPADGVEKIDGMLV